MEEGKGIESLGRGRVQRKSDESFAQVLEEEEVDVLPSSLTLALLVYQLPNSLVPFSHFCDQPN